LKILQKRSKKLTPRVISKIAGITTLLLALAAGAQTNPAPVFQYGVFYNSLLEFTWAGPMTVSGRVHANGDLYTGSAWSLTFNNAVRATGIVSSPPWDGHLVNQYTVAVTYKGIPLPPDDFLRTPPALLTNVSRLVLLSGFPDPLYSQTTLREMINQPPLSGDVDPGLAALRYYNKAGITLLISNATITAICKNSKDDPAPSIVQANFYPTNNAASNYTSIVASFPFLSVTNYWATNPAPITDQREHAVLRLTDINMYLLQRWLLTNNEVRSKFPYSGPGYYPNASNAPNILYVADNRGVATGQLNAIRLRTAQVIPTNAFSYYGSNVPSGFTLATPNPLYIYGNYNCPVAAYFGSTNTTAAGAVPASLVCDALTILSANWVDSQSALALTNTSKAKASATTINAAIIAGAVYSTGPGATEFSGGLHNFPRLLEDWSSDGSKTLTLNSSLVNLFPSGRATNQFQMPGVYYSSPTRNFSFDLNFLTSWKLPPGTPFVQVGIPTISAQPQNQKVPLGQNTTFSVAANGVETLHYQWKYLGPGSPRTLAATTHSSLTLSNIVLTNAGTYMVAITNAFGTTNSTNVTLTIAYPPVITGQPVSQSAPLGETAGFTVRAYGTNLTYTWVFNGSSVPSSGGASLDVVVKSNTIGSYQVIVSNPDGAATSSIVQLYLTQPEYFEWAKTATLPDESSWSRVDSVSADMWGRYAAGRFAGRTLDLGGVILTNNNWSPGNSANFLCMYSGQQAVWARIVGTNSGPGCPLRISRSGDYGFMLLAGRFSGTGDFSGYQKTSVTAADQFVLKFGGEGPSIGWVDTFPVCPQTGTTNALGLGFDLNQNEYFITGLASGPADLGQGVVLTNCNAYVAKLDLRGQILWAHEAHATDTLALGPTGDVYVAGSPGVLTHYDAQGNELWTKPFPPATAIVLDQYQNIYATGFGMGIFDGFNLTNSSDNGDFFVAKCDASGQVKWLRQIGSVHQQSGTAIAIDYAGNTYVTSASLSGLPEPAITIGSSTLSNVFTFIASYDPAGTALWARAVTSSNICALTCIDYRGRFGVGGYFTGNAFLDAMPLSKSNSCTGLCPEQMFVGSFKSTLPNGAITISAQPTNQFVNPGDPALLSVVASGGALAYQWFYNQTNPIPDATNSTLLVASVQAVDLGSYSVLLSNAYQTATSAVAILAFAVPPAITSPPQDVVLPTGQNAVFTVSVTGSTPLTYQWYFNGVKQFRGTTNSLTVTNASAVNEGQYTVIVTNIAGAATAAASLTIAKPPSIPQPLPNLTVALGQDAFFNVAPNGTAPFSYQWRFNGVILPEATNSFLSIPGVTPGQAGQYVVTVTNPAGMISATGSVAIATAPAFGQPLRDLLVLSGQNPTFTADVTGTGPLFYQWLFNGTNILDATNATLVLTNISPIQTGQYAVIITNIAGSVTNTAKLDIGSAPAIDVPMQDLVLLAGQTAVFSVSASGTAPLTYLWRFGGEALPDATDATLILTNVTPAQSCTCIVTVSNALGLATNSATLYVYPTAAATLTLTPPDENLFQFTVSGVPNFTYVIETSTNFIDWEPLLTNKSPFTLTDDQVTNFPARFYRATYAP
jgi:hypothetical protein